MTASRFGKAMKTQKTLIMESDGPSLRDECWGWTHEDSNLYEIGREIGYTPIPRDSVCYRTVLEAQAHGWRLLGPPQEHTHSDGSITYGWWLVR